SSEGRVVRPGSPLRYFAGGVVPGEMDLPWLRCHEHRTRVSLNSEHQVARSELTACRSHPLRRALRAPYLRVEADPGVADWYRCQRSRSDRAPRSHSRSACELGEYFRSAVLGSRL